MADKVLSFSIKAEVSEEALKLAALERELKKLTTAKTELLKVMQKESGNTKENQVALANLTAEIKKTKTEHDKLKKEVDTAGDSLNRMRARLAEMKQQAAAGSQELNTKLTPGIKKLSDEISKAEQAQGTFTRNIGNYPELFNAIPGPVGRAASSMQGLVEKLKMFGPVGALIGGGLVAISAPLVAFFTQSEKGVELLERKVAGFKGAMNVLKGELIGMGEDMVEAFDKPDKKAKTFWTTLLTLISPAWMDVGIKMDIASDAMERYTAGMQLLEDMERNMIVPRAEANLKIKEARLLYADENATLEVRISALARALKIENETADQEIDNQKKKILLIASANDELKKANKLRDSDEKNLQLAIARSIELETESVGRQVRAANTLKAARKELTKAQEDSLAAVKKVNDALRDQEILAEQEGQKFIEQEIKRMDAEGEIKWQKGLELGKRLFEQNKKQAEELYNLKQEEEDKIEALKLEKEKRITAITDAGFQGAQQGADAVFNSKRNRLQAEMEAELTNVNLTEQQKVNIRKKYGKEQQRMDITQAIINGALAVGKASMNLWPIPALPMMALAALTTGIQVATIKSQQYAKGGKITTGTPVYTGTKDDTMIIANKTETVLTQDHVQKLGGSAMMRHIKVPGYELGGYIGQRAPEIPSPGFDYAAIAKMINGIQVTLELNKLNKAQKELNIINETQRI